MDITVVGGGLGGLAAATLLARRGMGVRLLEKGSLGGRARTRIDAGFSLNLGPHALYENGHAMRILKQLGLRPRGGRPSRGQAVEWQGQRFPLPATPLALMTSPLLPGVERFRALGHFARLPLAPADQSLEAWLEEAQGPAADLLRGSARVATYAADLDRLPAKLAARQILSASRGVRYLDGGWQQLVDGLRQAAQDAGVVVLQETVDTLPDGPCLLAVPPVVASRLLGRPLPHRPVCASTLCLGLRRLPQPDRLFVLGLDHNRMASVHSESAKLGGVVLHAARYLGEGEQGDRDDLADWLDGWQPGWRQEVVTERFMPRVAVAWDAFAVGQAPHGVRAGEDRYLVGDWVGERGWLLDRALASAEEAVAALWEDHGSRALLS